MWRYWEWEGRGSVFNVPENSVASERGFLARCIDASFYNLPNRYQLLFVTRDTALQSGSSAVNIFKKNQGSQFS